MKETLPAIRLHKGIGVGYSERAAACKPAVAGHRIFFLLFLLLAGLLHTANAQNFRASASAGVIAGTLTLTINNPTGTVSGDVMIAAITLRPSTAAVSSVPTGWTLIRRTDQTTGTSPSSLITYYKVATASETTAYSWSFSASSGIAGGISTFYNISNASPINVENGQATASALTHATPSVTTTLTNTMVVTTHSLGSSATWTPPSGMTESVDIASYSVPNSAGNSLAMSYVTQATVGATGIKTATAANNAIAGATHIMALNLLTNILWNGSVSTAWETAGNWTPAVVPTASNSVVVASGTTYQPTVSTATPCLNLVINSGATVTTTSAGTLSIYGNLVNNGSMANSGRVTFRGAGNNTVTGASTTAFNTITVNKGSDYNNILDVQSVITMASGGLTMTNGMFKLSSNSTITPFTVDIASSPYRIPATAGLWINSGTVSSTGSITFAGMVHVSAGTFNVGNAADLFLRTATGASIIIDGGITNLSGRFTQVVTTDVIDFTMSAGTMNIATIGNTIAVSPFTIISAGSTFNMSGGTIIVNRGGSNNLGYRNYAATSNVTGGLVQMGGAASVALDTMQIYSAPPMWNLTVNSTNAPFVQLISPLVVGNALTINGGKLDANANNISVGGNWINNGTFAAGFGSVTFNSAASNTVTGSSTTAFNTVTIDKGTSSSSILDVQSVITMAAGGLTLINGTFKLSSNSTITAFNTDNSTAPYLIPSTAGLWVNAGNVASTNNVSFAGLVRCSGGILNFGNFADQKMLAANGAAIIVDGGTVNVAGRLSYITATDVMSFTISSGTFNVGTVGNTTTNVAPFTIIAAASSFTMSGGTIVISRGGGSKAGMNNYAATSAITGGTLQIGSASTPLNDTVQINSTPPIWNLTINNTNAPIAQLSNDLVIKNDITIFGGKMDANTYAITVGRNWINNGTFNNGTGTVTFNGTTVMSGTAVSNTFNNLTIAASSTVTSSTGITGLVVNGTLNTGASATLDLGTTTILSGTLAAITNNGTIKTAVPTTTSATPIPAGKTWGGTVDYTNASANQTVVGGSYNNLTVRPGAYRTATANGNIVVDGMLFVTTAYGALDLSTFMLSGALTGINILGDIRTSSTSATPVPAGKTWNGTFYYAATAGTQTVAGGTYNQLTFLHTSGTNTVSGNIATSATFRTTAGGTVDFGLTYRLTATVAVVNDGTIKTSVLTSTSALPFPVNRTWGGTGTVDYAATGGAQTVMMGTYNNLKLSNTSGTNILSGNVIINGTFTLSGGTITTNTNVLSLNASATVSRTGGHVIGNFKKYVATGATNVTFEIGDATNYTPATVLFASVTTADYLTAKVTATDHPNLAGSGIRTDKSVNRYFTITNQAIVFTTATLTLNWVAGDVDAASTTANFKVGNYNSPTWTLPSMASPLATSIQATCLASFGDFAVGELCGAALSAFSYTGSPYCSDAGSATPSITGTAGTFTFTPAGLVINASTGVVNLLTSTAGTYTVTNAVGGCSSANASITITAAPTIAAAGADQNTTATCGLTTVTLAGNTPTVGTGVWTIVAGTGGSIATTTSAVSAFSGTAGNTYTLRWTISNGSCISADDVVITFNQNPTTAAAGADQNTTATCGLTTVTLAGNTPAIGTGMWSIVAGTGGSIATPSSAVSTFSGTAGNTYTLRWTISNSPCTASTDDVVIALNQLRNNLIDYTNGSQGVLCTTVGENAVATLTAPAGMVFIHIGFASYGTPSGTCSAFMYGNCHAGTSQAVAETYFLGNNTGSLPASNNIFGDPCSGTVKQLTVQATYTQPICTGTSPGTITGSTPDGGSGPYTYLWEQSTTSATSGFSAASGTNNAKNYTAGILTQTTWYKRTVTSGGCTNVSGILKVPVTALPAATISYSGTPFCKSVSTGQSVTQTGTAGGTYSSTTGLTIDASTGAVTPGTSTAGAYTVTYTMAATGGCAQQTATTSVTIANLPTTAAAGADQNTIATCGLTTITLAGNTPTAGTGLWTIVAGTGGSIATPSSAASTFSGTAGNTYTLRWTISSSPCTPSTDDVVITFNQAPTVSNAGADQTGATTCGLTTVTLAANTPTNGTGVWSIVSGTGGTVTTPTSATSAFTGTAGATYILRWTISNSPCTPSADDVAITFNQTLSITGTTSTATCVGGATGTITTSASGGTTPYTYSLNAGAYQVSATFTGLAAGTYTLNVKSNAGCVASSSVIVSDYATATDDQALAGNNSWIGHMYDGTNYNNYVGQFTETENFNEFFGGNDVCFNVVSNSVTRSIYTESLSVKFRMASTKQGLYVADLGSDDGSRLTVDGTVVCDNYTDQGFTNKPAILMNLIGVSSLLLEYYENGGGNQVAFQNLTQVLANTLSTNTTQTICVGNTGVAIGGDVYGILPPGITVSGTGYQWSYSNNPLRGVRTNIAGATGATFTPSAAVAPFNIAGTYYIFRNAALSSANNLSPNPYVAVNESNAAMITVSAPPSAAISYAGNPFCSTAGTVAVTQTGTAGGVYSSSTGLMISANGDITTSTSTPGTYTVNYTMAASGGCSQVVASTSVTITALPVATFNYAASPYCKSAANPSPTFSGGGTAGTFTSIGLVFVSTATGQIDLAASAAGTYTITNTIASSGGCAAVTATTSVTITAIPSATISYTGSPYCSGAGTATVTRTGTAGGTYSSTTGLIIDGATGNVTLATSTAGTYTVTYTVATAGGCAAYTTTTGITITTQPSANGYYAGNPYCSNGGTATPTGTATGAIGTFSSSPGLSVNYYTGVVDLGASTPGTYTITYTVPASGGCGVYTQTSSITITAAPVAAISYAGSPYCSNTGTASVTRTGTTGGTYSSAAALNINASTGVVNTVASTAGTYTVTYTVAASGGCAAYTTTASVTITALPVATFNYAANPYCKNAANPSPTFTGGGVAGTFTSTGLVFVSAATGQIDLAASAAGTYTVTNTIAASGGCSQVVASTSVTITALPVATFNYAASPYCKSAANPSPTFTGGGIAGTFTSTTGLVFVSAATGQIDVTTSTAGTYTVTNTVAASGGCAAVTATTSITITAVPVATFNYAASPYCKNAANPSPTFSGGGVAGTFTSTTGLVFVNAATGQINLSASTAGTYTITNTIATSGGCAAVIATTSVTITALPAATISYTGTPYCSNGTPANVTFSGSAGGTYSSTPGLYINVTTGTVLLSASTAGTYTVTYTVAAAGGCSLYTTSTSIIILAAPSISQVPTANLVANYRFAGDASDATGNDHGTLQNSPALTTDRFNNAGKAYTFNGSTQYVSSALSFVNPTNFSISIWFKTTTTTGGKLIGFGNNQTGSSNINDRHIYMSNSGQIYFGCYPGSIKIVNSALSYNDGIWHLATATLSGTAGMTLYMDGAPVGTNATAVSAENTTGFWRIGYDNLNSWTNQPSSFYFNGSLDDALIYHSVLTAAEVAALYKSPDGAGNNGPVCVGSTLNLTATTVSGTYAWTGPNGFTSSLQNPSFVYDAANAGVYTLQVTSGGCTSTAYTNVLSSSNAGQWTGNISTDWANTSNWCSGVVPTSSTDVLITANATRMPAVISSIFCKSLTISTGASVSIISTGTLNIAGTLTNNGTFTDNGTTVFNGTSGQQTFSGVATFNNLTLNNTSGLLLPAAITVKNNLTITSGTLNANNNAIAVAGNWNNNASAASFSAGTGTVTFNGITPQTVGGSFVTNFNNLTISNTANAVSLSIDAGVTGNLLVAAGTFDIGVFTSNRTTAGGSLTVANNATLMIGGTGSFPANYTTVNLSVASTVEYAGANQSVASQAYGNLTLSSVAGTIVKTLPATPLTVLGNLNSTAAGGSSVSYTAASAITVGGNVSIGTGTTFSGGSYTHNISGNWVNNGTFNGNTGTLTFTGAGTTVSGSGLQNFNNLTVAASGVSFSNNSITVAGNLATTGSGSFTQATGGTLLMSGTGKTISGSGISLMNLTVSGSVSTANALAIAGNLAVSGSFAATGGTITMSGAAKTISGAGTISFAVLDPAGSITTNADFSISSALIVDGSLTASAGTATFTGTSSISGTANLYHVAVNGTSLQLSAGSVMGIAGTLTITSGALDVINSTPNTVNFNGTGAQNINGITYNNLVLSNGGTKTAAAAITTNDITIAASTTFNPSTYPHNVYGNWMNSGTFVPGTSTIQFRGASNTFISGPTTYNILTVNKINATTELQLQSNISAAIVNMTSGTLKTGANTLTITTTRNGNGYMYGNIRRMHSFTTGVAYAFEGPQNTITFSAVSGVSSITVSIAKGAIPDFPFGGSISRVYDITIPAGTYTATLRLHYEDDELNGNLESSMALWRYNGTMWSSIGKTANSTTANYIEQNGLTNITNRWTASDNSNLVQWNGSVSSDWNTAANWTVLQGAGSRPPATEDIVDLGTATFLNYPTITTPVTVKNIIFGSAKAVILTLGSGGSLTTSGDINGNWTGNATHTININNQNLTVNGNINLSDGTTGHAINLNIGTGTVTILGSLVQSGGANIVFSGAGTMNVYQNFNHVNGLFTAASGTVVYNGIENQDVANIGYYHLTINKTAGLAVINDSVSVAGNLVVMAGELNNFSYTNVAGNVTINPGGTFNDYQSLHVQGNWNNSGTYVGSGSEIIFDGAGTQNISASTFNNLRINKPVGSLAILTGDVILKGNLVGTSGTLDSKSFFFNRDVAGGTATIGDSGTLIIAADNAPNRFANYALAPNSTVVFNGTGTQHLLLPGVVYGNIIFRNSGTKILYTGITVNTSLQIDSTANFDAGANTITLNGNWLNNGTFIPGTSTVLMNGTTKTVSGVTTFNKVTIAGSYTLLNNTTFNDLLTITSAGSISGGSAIHVTMVKDLINRGILYALGTTTFTGTVLQTLSLINAVQTVALTVNFNGTVSPVLNSTSAPQYGFLNINNTGGINASVGYTILYALNVGNGASFNGGSSTHNIYGSVTNNGTITSSGTLNFTPATATTVNLGSNFSSTGKVIFAGAGAMTLAGTGVSFNNVDITNSNVTGITPPVNWNIAKDLSIAEGSILNAGSYTYSVGGNILNKGTINSASSTFVLNGSSLQDVRSGSAFTNLTVNKVSGSTTLSSNITVNGLLNFVSGNINTATNVLSLPQSGTVTGASQNTGWVNGKLQKYAATGARTIVKDFEVGDSAIYAPVTLALSHVTTAGTLIASTTSGEHPNISSSPINADKSVNRYWTFINNGVQLTTYDATFNFAPSDIDAGANTAAFGVGLYAGSAWSLPVVASPTDTSIQATGVTAFGDIYIGEVCNAGTAISYTNSPYCSNAGTATITRTGTSGGTYTSSTGLAINTTTGNVDISTSTPGTYSVTYTIAASGRCNVYATTTSITISAVPVATIVYAASPFCSNTDSATVSRTGTAGGTYSSTTGLTINPATGTINVSTSAQGTYTVTYTIAASGGCSAYQITTSVTIVTPGMWSGAVSTVWNVSGNWLCGAIPTTATNITIPGGLTNYPVLNTGTGSVKNLTIQSGATLTVSTATLQISGAILNSGTLSAGRGTIEMNGTTAQTIPAATFEANSITSLTISNAAGVSLDGTLRLANVLTIADGTLASNGYLTLKSTATATARVAPITSLTPNPISGNVTVERYIPGRRKYRLITSPVTTSAAASLTAGQENLSIWANWQNSGSTNTANTGTFITGGTVNDGFDIQTPAASLFTYDDVNRKFVGFTSPNGKNTKYTPLKAGVPYYMFVYGDRTNTLTTSSPNSTVLRATGTLLTGDQAYTTNSAIPLSPVTGRFTFLGNPFASPINWATIPKTNLENAYWGWDPNLSSTGGFITVLTTGTVTLLAPYSGNTGLNQYIQPGQGFFVRTAGASPTLTIREQDKVSNFNGNAFRVNGAGDVLSLIAINLQYANGSTNVLADGVLAAFSPAFSNSVSSEDGFKLANSTENIAILHDTTSLSIDARQLPKNNDTLFLNVSKLTKPQYTLQIFTEELVGKGIAVYLQDRYLNTLQPLTLTDTNNIVFQVNPAIAASFDVNRFRLVFRTTGAALPVSYTSIRAVRKEEQVAVAWEMGDQSDIKRYEVERGAEGQQFVKVGEVTASGSNGRGSYQWMDMQPLAGSNYYRVRAVQADGSYLLSKVVLVMMTKEPLSVSVYPNPVKNQELTIRCKAMEKGAYTVLIVNAGGQQVISQTFKHGGGMLNQRIYFDKKVAAGLYYLELRGEGWKYSQVLMVE